MLRDIVESAVGKVGRTSRKEAEVFVKNNPNLIKEFKRVVSKVGGKSVAAEILNLNLFGKPKEFNGNFKTYNQI